MHQFKVDLHIHSVFSPCGDLEMSPSNIVKLARQNGLDVIAVTDHNTTRQCAKVIEIAEKQGGLLVLPGAEACSSEEVHCLCIFPDLEILDSFQTFLDRHLPVIPNRDDLFGYQVLVDENDLILETEERYLGVALDISIDELEQKVHELGGLFIPAHVDRPRNSLFSQLGFLPNGLTIDALQISKYADEQAVREQFFVPGEITLVRFSDAHYPDDLGSTYTWFEMDKPSFSEIKKALTRQDGRLTRLDSL
jgi:hypothetical protein